MPDVLTQDQVMSALGALPGWTGDTSRIARHVSIGPDDRRELVGKVNAHADKVDHHPTVTEDDDGLNFECWTHSAGGVTQKDVDLAHAIDECAEPYAGSSAGG
jgi:4a-hydroxytetrahydrobiopterin dehydratase